VITSLRINDEDGKKEEEEEERRAEAGRQGR
jgi:hypothetical protein